MAQSQECSTPWRGLLEEAQCAVGLYLVAGDGGISVQNVHPIVVLGAVKHAEGRLDHAQVEEVQPQNARTTVAVHGSLEAVPASKSHGGRVGHSGRGGGGRSCGGRQVETTTYKTVQVDDVSLAGPPHPPSLISYAGPAHLGVHTPSRPHSARHLGVNRPPGGWCRIVLA
jgi:hypothetical protein